MFSFLHYAELDSANLRTCLSYHEHSMIMVIYSRELICALTICLRGSYFHETNSFREFDARRD